MDSSATSTSTRGRVNYLRSDLAEALKKFGQDPSLTVVNDFRKDQLDHLETEEFLESHEVRIHNGRELQENNVFGKRGFELKKHVSKVEDFTDPQSFRVYRKEVAGFVKGFTDAPMVFVGQPFIRDENTDSVERSLDGAMKEGGENAEDLRRHVRSDRAHHVCHNDYTEGFSPFLQMFGGKDVGNHHAMSNPEVRRFMLKQFLFPPRNSNIEDIEKKLVNPKRIVVLNLWRSALPESTVLEHCPLAVCSADSVKPHTLVPRALESYGDRPLKDLPHPFEIFLSKYDQEHQWFYFPQMKRDEVLLFKTFDSAKTPFQPPLHTAFYDPRTPSTAPRRKSCEIRVICIWPEDDVQSKL